MIERYSTEEMRHIWSDEAKWARWRRVELAVLQARGIDGGFASDVIPPHAAQVAWFEDRTGHDFVAWLQAWTAGMDPSDQIRELHFGLTSSDVVDTGLSLAILQSGNRVFSAGRELIRELATQADVDRGTLRVGRTHGRPAEVSSWGSWMLDATSVGVRAERRHGRAFREAAVAKISGPVGTYSELGRDVEDKVAELLGLDPAGPSTQVASRDRIADWAYSLVAWLQLCERIATQVRLGARDGELSEGTSDGQVGSSSMPQKRNPIGSENICGLARLGRGYLVPILESVTLWDERDISHSSVERTALPDLVAITEYALIRTRELLQRLELDVVAMAGHVEDNYVDLCKHWALCRLVEDGANRWTAHRELAGVSSVQELEDLVGLPLPEPAWFLRNLPR